MRMRVAAVLVALAVASVGVPQQIVGQASVFTEGQGPRGGSRTAWDTVWVFDGGDEFLASATSLLPDDLGGVFFVDPLLLKVHHLDPQGHLDWSWGRQGSGPGEVRAIRAIALDGSGNVVLVDSGNRRILTLSAEGRLLSEVPLAIDAGNVSGVVVLQSNHYVMATYGTVPWVIVDPRGQQVQEVENRALAQLSILQRVGLITKWKQDRWVFGLQNGNGWFTYRSGTMELASPYVEHTESPPREATRLPIGEGTVHSGTSLSVSGDTLAVLFAGSTRGQFHWLDRYDLQTGHYIDSLILPQPAKQAVVGRDGLVYIVTYDTVPTLIALRPRPHLIF